MTSFLENLQFKHASVSISEISGIHNQIKVLTNRMDSMEQYSRRTCLKLSGIPEERGEKTDDIVLRIANQFILTKEQQRMELHHICRSHRVSPPRDNKFPRDIIVRFVSYRDKARVFGNKRNLKNFNQNPSNKYKIYINEALTKPRAQLYYEVRKLVNNRELDSAWTYDGKIIVKTQKIEKSPLRPRKTFENYNPLLNHQMSARLKNLMISHHLPQLLLPIGSRRSTYGLLPTRI